ncbi:hypothetical protein T03_8172 [Trichinella britovi]|uniref:Uncharacterized protein n=1 Tax=Trichinella britovi TaxID=45882 RepID=A0A0V1AQS7_TRIBR|nr:hypothetical protein T03_8172 [Trichinella britovi]
MHPYKKSLANYRSIACNLSAYSQSEKGGGVWNKWDADEFRLARLSKSRNVSVQNSLLIHD